MKMGQKSKENWVMIINLKQCASCATMVLTYQQRKYTLFMRFIHVEYGHVRVTAYSVKILDKLSCPRPVKIGPVL